MNQNTLYQQQVWDREYQDLVFEKPRSSDSTRAWMIPFLTQKNGSCFEVGCFPGRYLAHCGDHGYELNGTDLTPRVDPEMKQWLIQSGYKVGSIIKGDFFALPEDRKFSLVYSHGFIEHFPDWPKVLQKQAALVEPGGLLMVTVPNFAGKVQGLLHRFLDRDNYDRHYVPSMDPELWVRELPAEFEVVTCEYFGGLDFWVGAQKRSLVQKLCFWTLRLVLPLTRRLPFNHRSISAYCGLVARRKT